MDNNIIGHGSIEFSLPIIEGTTYLIYNNPLNKDSANVQIYDSNGKLTHDLENVKIDNLADYGLSQEALHEVKQKTFAFPSHSIMPALMTLFSGKQNKRISKELFDLPHVNLNETHKQELDNLKQEVFIKTETEVKYDKINDRDVKFEVKYAIVCNNSKIYTETVIKSDSIFSDDSTLVLYLKKTFGIEGLRHFLAIILGLDENFRKGEFTWTLDEHMERLGYKRGETAYYNKKIRTMASEVVKILAGLALMVRLTKEKQGKQILQGEPLFLIRNPKEEWADKKVLDNVEINIVANPSWYKKAFKQSERTTQQYTKLMVSVVREDHTRHKFTLYLTPLLSIFWRMENKKRMTLKKLFEWCDIDHTTKNRNRMRDVKTLEKELDHMKEQKYLGDWYYNENCRKPFDRVITLTSPKWLNKEITSIKNCQKAIIKENKKKKYRRKKAI